MAPGLGTRARPTPIDAAPGKTLRRIFQPLFAAAVPGRRAADVRPWREVTVRVRLGPAVVPTAEGVSPVAVSRVRMDRTEMCVARRDTRITVIVLRRVRTTVAGGRGHSCACPGSTRADLLVGCR